MDEAILDIREIITDLNAQTAPELLDLLCHLAIIRAELKNQLKNLTK